MFFQNGMISPYIKNGQFRGRFIVQKYILKIEGFTLIIYH
jgi:hypothetical protein